MTKYLFVIEDENGNARFYTPFNATEESEVNAICLRLFEEEKAKYAPHIKEGEFRKNLIAHVFANWRVYGEKWN